MRDCLHFAILNLDSLFKVDGDGATMFRNIESEGKRLVDFSNRKIVERYL